MSKQNLLPQEKMHGSMFLLLKKFAESKYGKDAWQGLLTTSHIERKSYAMYESYPFTEMQALIAAAARLAGVTKNELKQLFGEWLVPDLLNIYSAHVNLGWKTFEMLLYTEEVMHKVARRDSNASPPILSVMKVSDKEIMIDYYSEKKMAALGIGIIKGIAAYYHESDKITVKSNTGLDDARVQIRITFK